MIISGGSRCNWHFFAKHLTNAKDNERVQLVEIRGLAGDNVLEAFREMDALASGTRCKNFFYHADINPREAEQLTPAQWEQAVDTLETNLGLEGHSRFVIEHEKEGRTHRHIIWSRIDTDSMTAVSDSRNFAKHELTARALEREFGHEAVRNAVTRDTPEKRPERQPKNWETFRGHNSGIDPRDVKREVTELWRNSDSGTAFMAALEECDYLLCQGDRRDFLIVDKDGDAHSLARRLAGVRAHELRAKMADIDRDALPTYREVNESVEPAGSDGDEKKNRARRRQQYAELKAARRLAHLERDNTQRAAGATITPQQTRQERAVSDIQEIAARQFGLERDDTPAVARSQRQREAAMEAELAPLRRDIETKGEVQQEGIGTSWWERAKYGMDRMRARAAEIWQEQTGKLADKWQDFVESRRQRQREDMDISR